MLNRLTTDNKTKRMKTYSILCLGLMALTGCEYTEQERQQFYQSCMEEKRPKAINFLDEIAISCACEKWSLRKDIKPKSEDVRLDQYLEERKKCYSEPIKMNYSQRKYFLSQCKKRFTETYYSLAEQMARGGMPAYAIAEIAVFTPGLYERGSNKDLVDCACTRLSTRDDFILPYAVEIFEQEYKKEAKECKKIWKSK